MKIVVETDDFVGVGTALSYLEKMQHESDEYATLSPEDYQDGYGPLTLGTEHMGIAVRVVGILHRRGSYPESRYAIETIRGET